MGWVVYSIVVISVFAAAVIFGLRIEVARASVTSDGETIENLTSIWPLLWLLSLLAGLLGAAASIGAAFFVSSRIYMVWPSPSEVVALAIASLFLAGPYFGAMVGALSGLFLGVRFSPAKSASPGRWFWVGVTGLVLVLVVLGALFVGAMFFLAEFFSCNFPPWGKLYCLLLAILLGAPLGGMGGMGIAIWLAIVIIRKRMPDPAEQAPGAV